MKSKITKTLISLMIFVISVAVFGFVTALFGVKTGKDLSFSTVGCYVTALFSFFLSSYVFGLLFEKPILSLCFGGTMIVIFSLVSMILKAEKSKLLMVFALCGVLSAFVFLIVKPKLARKNSKIVKKAIKRM